eukprot:2858036-Prymnesium_polylepis.1
MWVELEHLVAAAEAAGVSKNSPIMKQAQALVSALAAAARQTTDAPPDPMQDSMGAIFGDYVMPELDED